MPRPRPRPMSMFSNTHHKQALLCMVHTFSKRHPLFAWCHPSSYFLVSHDTRQLTCILASHMSQYLVGKHLKDFFQ
eukprot:m.115058 g.115058  ORF g.115058 m.115058 type:complete len:76 (+) comp13552_c0_seq4:364-591(+)